ncbi:Fc.00g039940.m01.CDS01 [Cosmosporella sp. VM-42]
MTELKAGDAFPEDVAFTYIPPAPETSEFSQCGLPIKYDASKEFKDKKVVLVSIPGAFTPTCSGSHIPSYTANIDKIKAKGVDVVIVVAFNDPYVMSGWGKANGVKDDSILFMSDKDCKFSRQIGWNFGERTGRFAIIIENGKVLYASKDDHPQSIETSGAEGVLAQL